MSIGHDVLMVLLVTIHWDRLFLKPVLGLSSFQQLQMCFNAHRHIQQRPSNSWLVLEFHKINEILMKHAWAEQSIDKGKHQCLLLLKGSSASWIWNGLIKCTTLHQGTAWHVFIFSCVTEMIPSAAPGSFQYCYLILLRLSSSPLRSRKFHHREVW